MAILLRVSVVPLPELLHLLLQLLQLLLPRLLLLLPITTMKVVIALPLSISNPLITSISIPPTIIIAARTVFLLSPAFLSMLIFPNLLQIFLMLLPVLFFI